MKVDIIYLDERLQNNTNEPSYETAGSAGIDVRACIDEEIVLWPGDVQLIPLGFKMHISDNSCAAVLLPRSGQGHKDGLVLGNLTGLIDSDYQGQVYASIWNRNKSAGLKTISIKPMQRIAQLVFLNINQVELNEVADFNESDRGAGGFGSTGDE